MTEEKKSIPFDPDFDKGAAHQDGEEKEKGFFAQIPPRFAFYMGLITAALLLVGVSGFFILLRIVVWK